MTAVTDDVLMATRADILAARTLFEATGAGGTTVDVEKKVAAKENAFVTYGGAPVAKSAYAITADTPGTGQTRFTFDFTLAAGVAISIFA